MWIWTGTRPLITNTISTAAGVASETKWEGKNRGIRRNFNGRASSSTRILLLQALHFIQKRLKATRDESLTPLQVLNLHPSLPSWPIGLRCSCLGSKNSFHSADVINDSCEPGFTYVRPCPALSPTGLSSKPPLLLTFTHQGGQSEPIWPSLIYCKGFIKWQTSLELLWCSESFLGRHSNSPQMPHLPQFVS